MEDDTKFQDAEEYGMAFNKEQLTFKDIVLQHLKKIGAFASVELRGGYFQDRIKNMGGASLTERTYIPDSREVYSNAVNYLSDILFPHFDEEMRKQEEEHNKKLKEVLKKIWDDEENEREAKRQKYREKKAENRRKLFRDLCSFLYRKKYLELGKIED